VTTIGVVVNPTAGRGRGLRAGMRAIEILRRRGHTVEDLSARDLESATARARHGVVDGLDALVVVGGDGMVHLGANVVADTGLPLGIVAAGTGNDLPRALGLPRGDIASSIRGRTRPGA
jgi:diacylglycerol kinase (ATP)